MSRTVTSLIPSLQSPAGDPHGSPSHSRQELQAQPGPNLQSTVGPTAATTSWKHSSTRPRMADNEKQQEGSSHNDHNSSKEHLRCPEKEEGEAGGHSSHRCLRGASGEPREEGGKRRKQDSSLCSKPQPPAPIQIPAPQSMGISILQPQRNALKSTRKLQPPPGAHARSLIVPLVGLCFD